MAASNATGGRETERHVTGFPAPDIACATTRELAAATVHELNVSIIDYLIDLERRDPARWPCSEETYRKALRRALDELHARALDERDTYSLPAAVPTDLQAEKPARTPLGTIKESYCATPCHLSGKPINNGMSYANFDTVEAAREWAKKLFRANPETSFYGTVGYVEIDGGTHRLGIEAWERCAGKSVYERVIRDTPVELTKDDLSMTCYPSTVMDYYEIVHQIRSDGSCSCGENKSRFPGDNSA